MPKVDEEVLFEVTITTTVGWSRSDCRSDEEWLELKGRVSAYDADDIVEVARDTFESFGSLVESSKVTVKRTITEPRSYSVEWWEAVRHQALIEGCIHPGVFATDKSFEHCYHCDTDVPREEL